MSFLEYAPAPSRPRSLTSAATTACSSTVSSFRPREPFATISPATEKHIAQIANANAADVDAAVAAARRAYEKSWSTLSGADRGKYLFRIARLVQERARELAVAESLDNGKPIKESRDVDIPLVAAWFFYYAGWADKLDHAGLSAAPRALGGRGPGHPVELSAAHARLEDRPGARGGQHGRAQAGRDHPAQRPAVRGDPAAGRAPERGRQHPDGRGRHGGGARAASDVDKVAFTGSTAVGRAIAKSVAGTGKRLTLELGGKAANIVLDDAPIDQAIEGIVNGIFFKPGATSAAPVRACSCRRTSTRRWSDRLKQRLSTLRSATRSTRTPTSARSTRASSSSASASSPTSARPRARSADRGLRNSRERLLVRADPSSTTSRPRAASRARRSSARCSRCSPSAPRPRRSPRPTTRPTGCRPGSGATRGRRSSPSPTSSGPASSGRTPSTASIRPSPFGGYKESGYGREGGRHGLAAYLKAGVE